MNLTVGTRCTLSIDDVAFGGEGVGRLEGFVVFVPFVLPGETVEAEIAEVKKSFARARLVRVIASSPDRVEPRCRYFAACGGCQYQHMAYEAQLRVKHKQIADLFQRIGGFDSARIAPVVPCPQPYGYRNRIMIRSQWNKPEQRLNIGFVRWDGGLVEDIEECLIAEPALSAQISEVRANPPPKGGLKVVLRIPPENWEVSPDSFFQTNYFLLPALVETVRGRLKQGGARYLLDLYCGVGFFGIELGGGVERFAGVEYDRNAIRSAARNAAAHGRTNGEFIAGPVEDVLPGLIGRFPMDSTAVVLDPPRKGCQAGALELLRRERPAQILYISCHPATMARDLNILCRDHVYELAQVVPLDMFPQTQHLECVADLRRPPN
ncbi:MAG: class I SAM-dependent RNA methyltransferase [Verrucomicrobiota bacterium]